MTSKTSDFARYERAVHVGAPLISRKDTIIIAMLVNIALLVVLFATASRRHEIQEVEPARKFTPITSNETIIHEVPQKTKRQVPVDEIDEILARFAEKGAAVKSTPPKKAAAKTDAAISPEYYVVKSGDSPWKIARKFHIDFEDLLKLNNLDEEKAKNLKIGQKLRIR